LSCRRHACKVHVEATRATSMSKPGLNLCRSWPPTPVPGHPAEGTRERLPFMRTPRVQTIAAYRSRGRKGLRETAKSDGRSYPPPHNSRGLPLLSGATTQARCVLDHLNWQPDDVCRANGTAEVVPPAQAPPRRRLRDGAAAGEDARRLGRSEPMGGNMSSRGIAAKICLRVVHP
jgi:hypothetical protein